MSKLSSIRNVAKWGAVPVALMVSGLLVWQSSFAAFSSTTVNPSNNWAAGTVALSDDDGGSTAMFTATALKPGSTASKCIVVTSSGSLASTVKLYATTYSTTNALGSYVNLSIQEVTGGTFASTSAACAALTPTATDFTGTLAAFATSNTSFSTGVSSWAQAGGTESKTFRVTYTLDAATPNSAQGGTAATGFTWEAQST